MNATYNITDDRLRLDPEGVRLNEAQYKMVKDSGFAWWPGRKLFVKVWTPEAEDICTGFAGTITEDDTPDDVESRVERFKRYAANDEQAAQYANKRASEANTRRQFEQASNTASKRIEEAEYWQRRIAGAIRTAEHKDRPDVIARRIKGLEADKRKHERNLKEAESILKLWNHPHALSGNNAWKIANLYHWSNSFEVWSALDNGTMTPAQAKEASIPAIEHESEHETRWINHLSMRLDYEKAYLDAVTGGKAEQTLNPPKPPRKVAKAPVDGLKKGDRVSCLNYWHSATYTGTIQSMGAKVVKIQLDPEFTKGNQDYYQNHPYECPRRYVTKLEVA